MKKTNLWVGELEDLDTNEDERERFVVKLRDTFADDWRKECEKKDKEFRKRQKKRLALYDR